MKTKIFTLLLTLTISVGTSLASDTEVDGIWYTFNNSSQTAIVTYRGLYSYSHSNEYRDTVIIPDTVVYNGAKYSVTGIDQFAFSDCSDLLCVTIGNNVIIIDENAFASCRKLKSVIIGQNVEHIKYKAFYNCLSLESITLQKKVTTIESGVFIGCSKLSDIIVSSANANYSSVEGVLFNKEQSLLVYCPNGKQGTYIVPNSVTDIGDEAFLGSQLTSIVIQNSVVNIGNNVFADCINLSTPVYNDEIFAYLPALYTGEYSIPEGIKIIVHDAFNNCTNLSAITMPSSLTEIEHNAFSYCIGLTNLKIPNNVVSIGSEAFRGCNKIKIVALGENLIDLGNAAFSECSMLDSVLMYSNLLNIGEMTFAYCTNLRSVEIPNSVTSISGGAFFECKKKKKIINKATTPQSIVDDVFYNVSKETCILYVPENAFTLYKSALVWRDFRNIIGIQIPEGIDAINPSSKRSSSARKITRDGQVLVETENNTYTLTGQEVK